MNASSILRSKTVATLGAGVLGAGLLGGVALAALPPMTGTVALAASDRAAENATDERARARVKAVLDALVAKNVITQAQEDAIVAALATASGAHPRLREFVGDVLKESVAYIGLPADAVRDQVRAGKSLGQIVGQRPGKSRDGLVADLEAKAKARLDAAVAAGTLTRAEADQLLPKVDAAIVKIVDRVGAPRPRATR